MKSKNWPVKFLLCATLVGLSLNLSAQSNDVLMTIGNEKVSKKEFEYVFKKNNKNASNPDEKSLREYLDLYINFKLKVIEAKSLGMDTVTSFTKELAGYRRQLATPYLTDKEVNEKLINEAFERSKKEVRASHILINCREEASPKDTLAAYNKIMAIRKRIVEKKEDFGKVATETSQDPSAKTNKGDLGYFTVFGMVYPFETAAYNTKVGSVSMPFRTQFGYHIMYVVDIRASQGEVRTAHIMLRSTDKSTPEEAKKAEDQIQEIYKRLEKGEKFEDLAKQYSDDKQSAKNGGNLPFFGAGKMVVEFETEAFALKNINDYSKPFKSAYGWHIVKLNERKAPPTFEESKNDLKVKISKDSRSDLNRVSFINKLKKEYQFKENISAFNKFHKKSDSAIAKLSFRKEQAANPNDILFSFDNKTYKVSDYALYVQNNQGSKVREVGYNKAKKDMYDDYTSKALLDFEEERLDLKYPDFKALMEEYRDGILLFELTDQKVWSAAVKDTLGLEAFFKNNQSKYMWNERLNATIYTCSNDGTAELVRSLLKNKKISQDSLLRRVNKQNPLNLTIKSDKFEKGEKAIIDEIAWKSGMTKNMNVNNTVVFVDVKEKIKAQPKKLSEVRGGATADYQNYLERQWLESLRKKYPVSVNENVFNTLMSAK